MLYKTTSHAGSNPASPTKNRIDMEKDIRILTSLYWKCKEAKVGETIICPSCKTSFIKKSYQSVFCKLRSGTQCKDNYWNNVDSNKRNNTTRISAASAAWMERQSERRNLEDFEHPFSSEGLGQS